MKFKILWAHVFMCLFFQNAYTKVIKYDVYQISKKEHTLNEVCLKILNKEYPLVEMNSVTQVDCMSTLVEINDFCEKTYPTDPYLIRGIVEKDKAYCQSASEVILKYTCDSKDEYCFDSSIGCFKLQAKLARRLKVIHHSIIKKSKSSELNCYFAKKVK